MTGGREQWSKNGLEYGATPAAQNYFQARYAIRHWWTGPVACKRPVRGVWGGPPDGSYQATIAASKLAFAPRGKLEVASVVKRDLWEIGLKKAAPSAPSAPSGGGRFATPPIKKLQGLGVGALLGLLAISAGVWIGGRKRWAR